LTWSVRVDHLREITRQDVLAVLADLHGGQRQSTLIALRSLFGAAKKDGVVFPDPTSRIPVGERESRLIQPLKHDQVQRTTAAAARPADPLIIALAAVHAARPGAIRTLQVDDVDRGNRRLTIGGRARPLDDLTHRLLLGWLDYRRGRWPNTANPHMLINQMTAMETGPVSGGFWLGAAFRGQDATLERLRVDRQLEEALTHSADPLHLSLGGPPPSPAASRHRRRGASREDP
jgi:integrase